MSPPHLLRLEREIRQQIYGEVLQLPHEIVISEEALKQRIPNALFSLSQTCRELRAETTAYLELKPKSLPSSLTRHPFFGPIRLDTVVFKFIYKYHDTFRSSSIVRLYNGIVVRGGPCKSCGLEMYRAIAELVRTRGVFIWDWRSGARLGLQRAVAEGGGGGCRSLAWLMLGCPVNGQYLC